MLYLLQYTCILNYSLLLLYMAKEVNEIKVKYRSGLNHGDIDGKPYSEYDYDYLKATTKCTKRYSNAVCLLMGISGCAVHLIEWLTDNGTEYVHNNKITRNTFIAFHAKHSRGNSKTYGHDSVNKAFKKLSDEDFLVPVNKGTYRINPLMYFSDTEDNRIRSIKYMMEFKAGVETKISVEVNRK